MFLRCCLLFIALITPCFASEPKLQLASTLPQNITLSEYLVSEKYDGFRAYWDGSKLLSRSGKVFAAPDWFTARLPNYPLDGELWTKRQDFSRVASIVSKKEAIDDEWREIKYMVFDLPQSELGFAERYRQLQEALEGSPHWVRVVNQWRVYNQLELMQQLTDYTKLGAEGLMLQHQDNHYRQGRSRGLIKLKPLYDDEAVVLEHLPGKGKYSHLMGSLRVQNSRGQVFRIGSGFTLQQRNDPPAIGSVITYQFTGYTSKGLPRFARFYRIRHGYSFDSSE